MENSLVFSSENPQQIQETIWSYFDKFADYPDYGLPIVAANPSPGKDYTNYINSVSEIHTADSRVVINGRFGGGDLFLENGSQGYGYYGSLHGNGWVGVNMIMMCFSPFGKDRTQTFSTMSWWFLNENLGIVRTEDNFWKETCSHSLQQSHPDIDHNSGDDNKQKLVQ